MNLGKIENPSLARKCERGDLNPYGVNRWILSAKRLKLEVLDIRPDFPQPVE